MASLAHPRRRKSRLSGLDPESRVTGLTGALCVIGRGAAWRFYRPAEGATNLVAKDVMKPGIGLDHPSGQGASPLIWANRQRVSTVLPAVLGARGSCPRSRGTADHQWKQCRLSQPPGRNEDVPGSAPILVKSEESDKDPALDREAHEMIIYSILYVAVCVLIGMFGNNRKMGFWGYLFASLFLTPPMGLLLLIVSSKKEACEPS